MSIDEIARKLATDDGFSLNPSDPQYFAMMEAYREKAREALKTAQTKGIRAELEAIANFRASWFHLIRAAEFAETAANLLLNVEISIDRCYITEEEFTEMRMYIHQIQGSANIIHSQLSQLIDELELTEGDFLIAFKNALIIRNDL